MFGWSSATANTVGGAAGVTLTYNSLASSSSASQDQFPGLPLGWTASWGQNSVVGLSPSSGSAVVRFEDGSSQTFTRKNDAWVPPESESDQLVSLITAQRYFQANAKAIDTETQVGQTVLNLRS